MSEGLVQSLEKQVQASRTIPSPAVRPTEASEATFDIVRRPGPGMSWKVWAKSE